MEPICAGRRRRDVLRLTVTRPEPGLARVELRGELDPAGLAAVERIVAVLRQEGRVDVDASGLAAGGAGAEQVEAVVLGGEAGRGGGPVHGRREGSLELA